MDNTLTGKVSQKGQLVIPASIRRALGIEKGSEVSFEVKDNEIRIKKVPTALEWANLVEQLPEEKVDIDKTGNYDPKKAPHFHDWMVNG